MSVHLVRVRRALIVITLKRTTECSLSTLSDCAVHIARDAIVSMILPNGDSYLKAGTSFLALCATSDGDLPGK
jgi:hypothetical protein